MDAIELNVYLHDLWLQADMRGDLKTRIHQKMEQYIETIEPVTVTADMFDILSILLLALAGCENELPRGKGMVRVMRTVRAMFEAIEKIGGGEPC